MSIQKYFTERDIRESVKDEVSNIIADAHLEDNDAFFRDLMIAYGIVYKSPKEEKYIHKIFTPIYIIRDMLAKLPDNFNFLDNTFAVLYTIEIAIYLHTVCNVSADKITVVTDSIEREDCCDEFKFNRIDKSLFLAEEYNMKFDVVLGNPPYNDNTHLTFLEKSYDLAKDYVLFVHPAGWLMSQKSMGRSMKWKQKLHEKIGKHFDNFTIIQGNVVFNIALFVPCVISVIDKNKINKEVTVFNNMNNETRIFSNILKINPLFCDENLFDIKDKIWMYSKNNNIEKQRQKSYSERQDAAYHIYLQVMSGGAELINKNKIYNDDFYRFTSKKDSDIKNIRNQGNEKRPARNLSFYNLNEAENCLDYSLNSKIAKFALMTVKIVSQIDDGELKYVPSFDFSERWDDEKIAKELGLTDAEVEFIMSVTK